MTFHVLTIFPEMFGSYLNESILKKAQENKILRFKIWNLRNFSKEKHKKVDDRPFGGGPGMVFMAEPIILALKKIKRITRKKKKLVIFFSPAGRQFNADASRKIGKSFKEVILIAGRYEGVDERVISISKDMGFKTEKISLGPYVLTGGELPALVLIDSVSRQLSGVLGKIKSLEEKRSGIGVPVYTRPETVFFNRKKYQIPRVLLSGDHKKIENWKKKYGRKI